VSISPPHAHEIIVKTRVSTPSAGKTYRRLLSYSSHYWPTALLALLGMLLEAAAAGAFTWLMKPMIDGTFVERDQSIMHWLPLAIILIFIIRGIAVYTSEIGMARIGRNVVRTLREQVFSHYLRLPSRYFDQESTARALSRLSYDAEQVYQASSDAIKTLITDSLTIICLLGVMLLRSTSLTLTMLFTVPAITLIVALVSRRYRRISTKVQSAIGEVGELAEQALRAQDIVKIFGAENFEVERYRHASEKNRKLQLKMTATTALSTSTVQLLAAFGLAFIVYKATMVAQHDQLTAGAFMSLIGAMMAMLPSLKKITTVQGNIQKGVAAAQSLFGVLDQPVEKNHGQILLERAKGEIEFRNVTVRYSEQKSSAVENINLVCKAGTVTALVGRSGSGKSTLVRLLGRLYEPSSGQVLLDGRPLTDYSLADLRRQIAVVTQDIALFNDTIAHNIAYGALSGATEEQIRAAAQAANAIEFIDRLPLGFDSPVGEGGALLSGGQRQRIAIARAILKNTPILILDEATSALDAESERLIQDALSRIMQNRTTLVIAHRLSTIEHADQVIVLDHGRMVEQGTHAELLEKNGKYAFLYKMQFRENSHIRQPV